MRIRSIKPEFWRSDDVAALSLEDRLLFIGLWSYVDDSGIGVDKLPHICADLFAPDLADNPHDTLARVSGGLLKLTERGMIQRYKAGNKPYLYITNWSSHQRIDKPGKQRFPGPDQADPAQKPNLRESVANVTETLAPGTGEQGNRGTGEQIKRSSAPAVRVSDSDFDSFWSAWPLKKGKQPARKAFEKAIKSGATLEEILRGMAQYKQEIGPAPDWSKVKWPQGWLTDRRWEDEPTALSGAALNAQWDAALADHKPDPCASGHKWVGDGSCARYPCPAIKPEE